MKWIVVAPFFNLRAGENRWIDDFISDPDLQFEKVSPVFASLGDQWHKRKTRATPLSGWIGHWASAWKAMRTAGSMGGVITVFPQLAIAAAVQKRLLRRNTPIVAWCFNIGAPPGWLKRRFARYALKKIDQFVVHSRREISLLNQWFAIPSSRIKFVALQRGEIPIESQEELQNPFILAMGSANRDYTTLIKAIELDEIPLTIVASERCLRGIQLPPNVTWLQNISHAQCLDLAAKSRISVVPLGDVDAASGQVTFVEAMTLGRPVIATDSPGSRDYIQDGVTGLLVPPNDPHALRVAIKRLWQDNELRTRLSVNARHYAEEHLSDEAAAQNLSLLLKQFTPVHGL